MVFISERNREGGYRSKGGEQKREKEDEKSMRFFGKRILKKVYTTHHEM